MLKPCFFVILAFLIFNSCGNVYINNNPGGVDPGRIKITTWLHHKRQALSFTFDDNNPIHSKIGNLLHSYNFKGSFFINVGLPDFPDMKDEYQFLFDQGHEIGNHTYSHTNLLTTDSAGIEKEVQDGARAIEKYFGVYPVSFVHPNSAVSGEINRIVFRHELVCRVASPYSRKNRLYFDIGSTWPTLKKVKREMRNPFKRNPWTIIAGHGVGENDVSWDFLEGLCNMISSDTTIWVDKLSVIGTYDYLRREIKINSQLTNNALRITLEGFNQSKYTKMEKLPITLAIPYLSNKYSLIPAQSDIETEISRNVCYLTFDIKQHQYIELKIVPKT